MKRHNHLFLLLHLVALGLVPLFARQHSLVQIPFVFTAKLYNISLEENAPGTEFARSSDHIRIGVPLPHSDATVKFKIVEGDRHHHFKAHSRQVGDFVFLRIRQKDRMDTPLNRELKDHYEFLVKATCRQKEAGNLEATARVHLTITDRNDAMPIFTLEADQYEATISDQEASDADEGINGQIYYSLVNRSSDFTVDPISGWIRTLRHLRSGTYKLKVRSEDRTSRLFYDDADQIQPAWSKDVVITVTETKRRHLKLLVANKPINGYRSDVQQLAATIRVDISSNEALSNGPIHVGVVEDDLKHWFSLVESGSLEWQLYTVPGRFIPSKTNVTISAGQESASSGMVNTTANIRIEVGEPHSIAFEHAAATFHVNESSPLGYVIGKVSASALYKQDEKDIRYYLEMSDNATVPFEVSEKTGVLRVAQLLDYEKQRDYTFNILAKLAGFGGQSSIVVTVLIKDSNDHSPVWAAKWNRQGPIAISNGTAVGTVILKVDAIDLDSGENARLGYKLSSDSQVPFTVNFETGEISLSAPLKAGDNEWRVAVWAVDSGRPLPRSTVLNLVFYRNGTKIPAKPKPVIGSEPANKHEPVFEDFHGPVEVEEDAAVGTAISAISATDLDVGYGGLVRYSLWDDHFSIDSETGVIRVAGDLSELLPPNAASVPHDLEVFASDEGSPRKSSKTTIKFIIRDVNNNAPQFQEHWYRIHVSEDTKVGTVLLKLTATDDDGDENGKVGYRLAGGQGGFVRIDEISGELTLARPLDRETNDVLRYAVIAFDHGSPSQISAVNLTIEVDDVNDNAPYCIEPVTTVRIPEDYPDGAMVGCLTAYDPDVGQNARLRFSIEAEENGIAPPFRIDHHSGCVFIHSPHQPLDFQRRSTYNLSIDVGDNGETVLSTNCSFVVELEDVDENLHPPEFDDIALEASVYENMPIGTDVLAVKASDPDNPSALLDYNIVGGSGMAFFAIDSSGTIRTSKVLDREQQSTYWLTVEANDSPQARVAKAGVLHVFVRVLDRNDHRPVPVLPIYHANVKENSPQNVVVVKIDATDGDDIDPKSPSSLHYKITKGDPQSFFRIDQYTGYITTSGSRRLDRETQREHELWVSVCDSGEPQLCSSVPVVVTVEDVNDNAPTFTQPIIHHNVPAGVAGRLSRVFANDIDSGKNAELFYNITEGDPKISIDENGYISTSTPMKPDEVATLTIQATDRGAPAQMTQTRAILTAVAAPVKAKGSVNRAPQFAKGMSRKVRVSDADQVGFTIGKFEAVDPDGDAIWWSIVGGNINETFSLKADSGLLQLAKSIENLPYNESTVVLSIRISDGLLEDTTEVAVELSRSPLSRPIFSAQHYKTQISEKTAVGTQIYTVRARSSGVSRSSKPLLYGVHSVEDTGMEDKLRVEPTTGSVLVMEALDYEVCREIRAIVFARQGTLTSYATLTVTITDDNDNAPRFAHKDYVVALPSSSPVGSSVATVLAHDADSGENGLVEYSIISGNQLGLFTLDPILGVIAVAKRLPAEHKETILTSMAMDELNLRFSRALYQRTVRDSVPLGSVLLTLATIPNGNARYSLKRPCPYFDVHPASGAVSLSRWLTKERAKSVACTAVAKNRAGSEDTAKVVIKIASTNQHSPIFKQQFYRGFIRENSPSGSSVLLDNNTPLLVSATDKDVGPSSLIGYRLLNPNEPYFVVDFVTGAIRSRKPLDYEKLKEWTFHVQASDMGEPVRSSPIPAVVHVTVLDTNDQKPAFTKTKYEVDLILPTVPGVVVATPTAVDEDTVGKLRYAIKGNTHAKLFSMNSTDGSITLLKSDPKSLNLAKYVMEVLVSDGVHTATATVEISVRKISTDASGFRFPLVEYQASVKENATFVPGESLIAVTAVGAPEGASVTYRILNEREEVFIHESTGMISLTGKPFDREEEPVVRLLVQAQTHEVKPQLAQTVVAIRVDDINDCAPIFVGLPYDVVVSSDSPIGEKILAVKAIDKDIGMNGIVRYHSASLPKVFKLNKHDGRITVNEKLGDAKWYRFEVIAIDQGEPPLKTVQVVRVDVVEKARPIFTKKHYEATVSEAAPRKTIVSKVKAASNVGGHLVYTIEEGNDDDLFVIGMDSAVISVNGELDAEERAAYNLTVMVRDVTRDGLNSTAVVNIELTGVNDNGPRFEHLVYRVNVSEAAPVGTKLLTVKAVDPDGENELISYAVTGRDSSIVHMDSATGVLSLAQLLDFEKRRRYEMSLAAADSSQLVGKSKLVLTVEDVNDEPPRFSTPFASAVVSDTATAGQFIAILSVTDDDTVSSIKGGHRFLYSVIEGDETLFSVAEHSGEVSLLRPIDADDTLSGGGQKTLNVSVSDGLFTAYGQLTVSIVMSGNRHPPPRFEQSQYVIDVRENNVLTNKTSILTVQALDGVPPLHYSMGGGDNRQKPLRIEKLTGRIHPKIVFTYHLQQIYKVPLVVEDALGRKAFSTLTVNVMDVNDSAPVFVVGKYSATVSANAREGETLLMVSASDDDSDDTVEYSLMGDDHITQSFRIHPRHGTLSLVKTLDSLVGSSLNLAVRATDQANPPHHANAQVSISVLPDEVSIPKFSSSHYLFVIPEDSAIGTVIGKLQQTEDVSDVRFTLVDAPADLPFSVERATGQLLVSRSLDREMKEVWRFVARADAANSAHSMAMVTVRLSDVNDHAPSFTGAYDRLVISEDAPVGTTVAVFSAIDADRSPGGRISFSLVEKAESKKAFKVDAESGWLVVAAPLDRELQSVAELVIRATDEGGLFTDHPFKIEITDVNDEAPQFDENFYIVYVDSSILTVGQIVARVVITDKDLPPFNNTRLFISRGNDDGLFAIDDSGKISIARLSQLRHSYNLTILAFDGVHATTATMNITLNSGTTSTFECDPEKEILVEVPEDISLNKEIYREESPVLLPGKRYLLVSSEVLPFAIDPNTGSISVKGVLDAESRKKFVFTRQLEVKSMAFSCSQPVEVRVIDVNDEAPVFTKTELTVSIKENEPASESERSFVVRVHAVDKDSGAFGRVQYSLASDHGGTFVIDRDTGAITVTRPLDREQTHEYLLHVVAQDSDPVNPKSAKAMVLVSVLDQNDNPPLFERSEYVLQVMESESVGYTLATVHAEGGDAGETVRYKLAENGTHNGYVTLDEEKGILTLAKGLDYEKEKLLSLTIVATDSGSPPLSSEAVVTVQVLDENDNIPKFMKESYKATIDENSPVGTKVVKVRAEDADSEHYGRVAYSLIKDDANLFQIDEQGLITVAGPLDRETRPYHRFEVEARDGGEPPQKSTVTVLIDVNDVNDNSPVFADCNMTAVVQEGVLPGHTLLPLSITDADGPNFGEPFRVEVRGEGAKAFRVDDQYNLVTVTRFDHARRDRFLLTLIAYDRGNRSTDCPLTVFVKEESRHPPRISPLRISLNTLMGEFKGGVVGTVQASDEDAGDMLRFSIVDGSVLGPLPTDAHPRPHVVKPHLFRVDANTGEVWSDHGIPGGLHAFNVSVTDGKFTTVSYVEVLVTSLEQDAVDHAVAVRLKGMTALEFFAKYAAKFKAVFAQHLNVDARNIQLLSVQETPQTRRPRSVVPDSKHTDLDILFTVSRGGGRGMLKPDHVYTRLKHDFQSIVDESGTMKYQLTTEMCTPGVCQRGECRERVYLDDQQQTVVSTGGVAFVAPNHHRVAECICPEGYGGSRCEQEINACARSPCHPWEMCLPSEGSRFECVCPPGSSGDKCSQASCANEGRCLEEAELSVGGSGYFEMSIAHEMETRMELEVELKTTSLMGVILHAHGPSDYHMLELVNGRVLYRWDAGSGEGTVATDTSIADAQWHRVSVSRRGRRTRLQLDGVDTKEGWSPAGSDVINLYSASHRLFFGARVERENSSSVSITKAIVACFRAISIDRRSVAKTRQGLRLYSASTGCRAMAATPCSEAPCRNGGTCQVIDKTYQCTCPPRYSGANCEIDMDPCGSRPCPLGIQCIPFYNEYLCKCPNGFTGKRCEIRGYDLDDACAAEPCGMHGTCIPIPKQHSHNLGYICNCTYGFSGKTCDDIAPPFLSRISLIELIIALGILVLIITAIFAITVLRRCLKSESDDGKYGEHVHAVAHVRNPHVVPPPVVSAPPPLPPRAFRGGNQMISNLEQAQLTGLPTVQVRPLPQRERLSSSGRGESRSPSLVGTGKQWKRATDYGSAADDLDESGRTSSHDSSALEALRRFGLRVPEEEEQGRFPSNKSRGRVKEPRQAVATRDALSALNQERVPLTESIQCLPTSDGDDDGNEKWGDGVDRIGAAIQMERLRIESLTGRVNVGETMLSPVVNDDDYMTMRPRRSLATYSENQQRPLLDHGDDSDGTDDAVLSSQAPQPPSHKNMFTSRIYDDPPTQRGAGGDTDSLTTSAICDIDASDVEELSTDALL
uniref:Cadherin domain protein n=1 Tax=Haemonchus contortus TaxID=6289 RepID=A0A7I4YD34_HAECO